MVKKFKAEVIAEGSGLGWRAVDIPFDVKKAFGSAGRIAVKGTINGFPFRTSIFSRKNGPHMLMLNKQMQKGACVTGLGEKVEIVIEPDTEKRTVEVPAPFKRALAEDAAVRKY